MSTLFLELVHSTAHSSRLDRDLGRSATTAYAKEELTAEIGGTFLCGQAGIENATIENSAAYSAEWLRRLRNDKRLIVHSSSNAQKAIDYIFGERHVGERHAGT